MKTLASIMMVPSLQSTLCVSGNELESKCCLEGEALWRWPGHPFPCYLTLFQSCESFSQLLDLFNCWAESCYSLPVLSWDELASDSDPAISCDTDQTTAFHISTQSAIKWESTNWEISWSGKGALQFMLTEVASYSSTIWEQALKNGSCKPFLISVEKGLRCPSMCLLHLFLNLKWKVWGWRGKRQPLPDKAVNGDLFAVKYGNSVPSPITPSF